MMRIRLPARTARSIAFAACLVAAVGCGPDSAGRVESGTHRIVSLVPAATEMLFDMGAGSDVIAVSSFDRFPPEVTRLPSVGALVDPDFERILTLEPTLVVVYGSQDDLMGRLDRASIPYFRYTHAVADGLGAVTATMRELGRRVGRDAEAEVAADRIERRLDEVRAAAAGRARPATALVFGREPGTLRGIQVSGGVGFLHDLLVIAGGRNAFEDVARENLQASVETMLQRAPEVIIELRTVPQTSTDDTDATAWNRLATIPAVRNGRITVLADPGLSIPGPRVADAARAFLSVLHPESQ